MTLIKLIVKLVKVLPLVFSPTPKKQFVSLEVINYLFSLNQTWKVILTFFNTIKIGAVDPRKSRYRNQIRSLSVAPSCDIIEQRNK